MTQTVTLTHYESRLFIIPQPMLLYYIIITDVHKTHLLCIEVTYSVYGRFILVTYEKSTIQSPHLDTRLCMLLMLIPS